MFRKWTTHPDHLTAQQNVREMEFCERQTKLDAVIHIPEEQQVWTVNC